MQKIDKQKEGANAHLCNLLMVTSRVFEWNTLKQDLFKLYNKLVDLGIQYREGQVCLSDLELN